MCASPLRGAAVADATAEEPCVCRRFASDIFVRSVRHCELHAVERSNPCRSFAGTAQSTGARRRQLSMDHQHRRPKDAVLRTLAIVAFGAGCLSLDALMRRKS